MSEHFDCLKVVRFALQFNAQRREGRERERDSPNLILFTESLVYSEMRTRTS